jgi:hypothetical protein
MYRKKPLNSEPNHTMIRPKAENTRMKLKRTKNVDVSPLFNGVLLQMKFTGFCKMNAITKEQIIGKIVPKAYLKNR